jgi:hypothetical protein
MQYAGINKMDSALELDRVEITPVERYPSITKLAAAFAS